MGRQVQAHVAGLDDQRLAQAGVEGGRDGRGVDLAVGGAEAAGDRAGERVAHGLDEEQRLLGLARRVGDGVEDRGEVADRDPLAEQAGQHLLDLAHREQVRDDLLDEARDVGLEGLEELRRLGAAEDLVGVGADRLGEVRGEDRGGVDHRVAHALGELAVGDADPGRGHAEHGLGGGDAVEGDLAAARVHREQARRVDLGARDLAAAQADDVVVGLQREVVADPDGRDDEAELGRDLAADEADPLDEPAAGARRPVHEADQAVADGQLQGLDAERLERRLAGAQLGLVGGLDRPAGAAAGSGASGDRGRAALRDAAADVPAERRPRGRPTGRRSSSGSPARTR